jgi:hypothetical protein
MGGHQLIIFPNMLDDVVSCISLRRHRDSVFKNSSSCFSTEVVIAYLVYGLDYGLTDTGIGDRLSAELSNMPKSLYPTGKRQVREAERTPASSAEVNAWSHTSTPKCLHGGEGG